MPKPKIELSDEGPAAKAAGFWSVALAKCRFNSTIKYRDIITTIDYKKNLAIVELTGISMVHLRFTTIDARILRECTSRVIKKPVQFVSLEINGKTLVITLKF